MDYISSQTYLQNVKIVALANKSDVGLNLDQSILSKIRYADYNYDDDDLCFEKRQVSNTKIERFKKMYNLEVFETSAKLNWGIVEAIEYLLNEEAAT